MVYLSGSLLASRSVKSKNLHLFLHPSSSESLKPGVIRGYPGPAATGCRACVGPSRVRPCRKWSSLGTCLTGSLTRDPAVDLGPGGPDALRGATSHGAPLRTRILGHLPLWRLLKARIVPNPACMHNRQKMLVTALSHEFKLNKIDVTYRL